MRSTDPSQAVPSGLSATRGCRSCGADIDRTVIDLGLSPLCQTVIRIEDADRGEPFYPLRAMVCESCWLVQVGDYVEPDGLFQRDYPYFSSFSDSWVDHARGYVEDVTATLGLDAGSRVVEVGSNDGYLLQWFVKQGISALGVDPAQSVVAAAHDRGVRTVTAFFGATVADELVAEGWQADLVCGANVMAQVPDLNDFVAGLAQLVKPTGTVTIEFPHLMALIHHTEFDTIYHEHFSYFSLTAVESLYARHGLVITDVEELATHGGSLRVWAQRELGAATPSPRVSHWRERERVAGVASTDYYRTFADQVQRVRRELLNFLFDEAAAGRTVAGYGAPGKGNTLLNFCGIRPDLLAFTVDRNPAKQDVLLPGSRIPVYAPEMLSQARPDTILILPWNLRREISSQLAYTADWGAMLAVPIPGMEVWAAGTDSG